jgi:hypothetical protein
LCFEKISIKSTKNAIFVCSQRLATQNFGQHRLLSLKNYPEISESVEKKNLTKVLKNPEKAQFLYEKFVLAIRY